MAKQLEKQPKASRLGRPVAYPWKSWTNGKWWKAQAKKDFKTSPESFRRLLYRVAERQGLKVETMRQGDDVLFQFFKKQPAKGGSS